MSDAEASYRALAKEFADDPRVRPPADGRGRFGSNGFTVDGKVFAMTIDGSLVVKLPAKEIDEAIADGRGARLTMGNRVMKEWFVVRDEPSTWNAIAARARRFVGGDR